MKRKAETDSWTPLELPFKAVNGKSIDPVKLQEGKYKLGIVLSSSVDGAISRELLAAHYM